MKTGLCALLAAWILAGCASDSSYYFTPDPAEARMLKDADAHGNKGEDLLEKGEFDKAIQEFTEAIRLNPKGMLAYFYRGVATMLKGEPEKAIPDFDEAIKLNANYSDVYEYRGIAHGLLGNFQEAVSDFKKVVELDPKSASGYSCLAALLATCKEEGIRNGGEAVQAATKACELTNWKIGLHIHRLAAAYAESGDWEKAVSFEKKALNVGAATAEEHNRMIINLSLYENRVPFRDPTIFQ